MIIVCITWFTLAVFVYLFAKFAYRQPNDRKRANGIKAEEKLRNARQFQRNLELQLSTTDDALKEKRQWILGLPVMQLVEELQSARLTCVEVLQAYQFKAIEVTKEFNCVTEFVKEAEDWAKERDKQRPPRGPLHGVPFCVKDNIDLAGYDSTFGLAQSINQPRTRDAVIVAVLKEMGAVPFCKTNTPQAVMTFGCSNPVWGMTTNPLRKDRTSGGSSGGDVCLVAAGGSAFAIGSDAAGSVRVPAAFCGIFGIKLTKGRFSSVGFRKPQKDSLVSGVPGLIARDLDTMAHLAKLLTQNNLQRKHDLNVVPIPWQDHISTSKRNLRIGLCSFSDSAIPPTPSVLRALQLCRKALERDGHTVTPFTIPDIESVHDSQFRFIFSDNVKHFLNFMKYEEADYLIKDSITMMRWAPYIRPILERLLKQTNPRTIGMIRSLLASPMRTTEQLRHELSFQMEYRTKLYARWRQLDLDLCLSPVFPGPAPKNEDVGKLGLCAIHCCLQNYADFPGGTVPVTEETEEDQTRLRDYCADDAITRTLKETTMGAAGMPVAVQVFGMPFEEELVLHGMKVLASALESYKKHQ